MAEQNLPKHVGIIMDGNGRWAADRGLPRNAGHKKGAEVLRDITKYANQLNIKYLTVFAFSTENFKRPKEEVEGIFGLMRSYLKEQKKAKKENIKLKFIGDIKVLPVDIYEGILDLEESTKQYTGLNFNIAFNYGGRQDILQAAKKLAIEYQDAQKIDLVDFSEADFQKLLYTENQPDLDLLIRTSGEFRISNFLIWQAAYAEFIFTPVLWPDFNKKDFSRAIEEFSNRNRRLGGV